MNPEELESQIRKFKARRLRARLSYYSLVISLFLAFSTFGAGATVTSLISFLLILPLPLYFFFQSLKLYGKTRHSHLQTNIYDLRAKFSLGSFLAQPSFAFRLSLVLFFLVVFTTLAQLHAPVPSISYLP